MLPTKFELMNTIVLPKNLKLLKDKMPKSKYKNDPKKMTK